MVKVDTLTIVPGETVAIMTVKTEAHPATVEIVHEACGYVYLRETFPLDSKTSRTVHINTDKQIELAVKSSEKNIDIRFRFPKSKIFN